MLTGLKIGNFKAFGETQHIPIRPLTLIFGANSSGKSSIIHGLLLARHALETGNWNTHRTALGGDSMDLGGFGAYVHRQDLAKAISLGLDLRLDEDPTASHEAPRMAGEISLELEVGSEVSLVGKPLRDGAPKVLRGCLKADGTELVSFINRRSKSLTETLLSPNQDDALEWGRGGYRVELRQPDHPATLNLAGLDELQVLRDCPTQPTNIEWQRLRSEVGLEVGTGDLIPQRLRYFGSDVDLKTQLARPSLPVTDVSPACRVLRSLERQMQEANRVVGDSLRTLQYLGPLRSIPARYFESQDTNELNRVAGGAFAWDVLRRDEAVRSKVNAWLGSRDRLQTPYALTFKSFLYLEGATSMIADELYAVRDDFKTTAEFKTEEPAKELIELLLRNESLEWRRSLALQDRLNGTVVSHRDVGVGVSQLLPVLVHAFADREQIVAIEQPEIHLHPALQAELGDVFIESALGERKNTFLLETHSEHLILRILRRIRETTEGKLPEGITPIRPQDVAVVYVQPGPKGAEVIELPVTPDGDFDRPWPGGFFAERFRELP